MNRCIKGVLAVVILGLISIRCADIASDSGNGGGSNNPDAVGTWAITDEGNTKGYSYVFSEDNSVTGSAIDKVNDLLVAFGGEPATYAYTADKVTMEGSEIGTYVIAGDSMTLNWTTSGTVEHCVWHEPAYTAKVNVK